MKRIEFTIQFIILLAAIPFLVFMQFKHDDSYKAKDQTQIEFETAYKPSVSDHVFPSTVFELD